MPDIQELNPLDEALAQAAKHVKTLYYIEPTNEDIQKEEFLEGRIQTPRFTYKKAEYDTRQMAQRLSSMEGSDSELGWLLERKKSEILLENKIIANLSDEDIIREASTTLYGVPSENLVSHADELLNTLPNIDPEKPVSAETLRQALQEGLDDHGLDWTVEFSDKKLVTVYPAESRITICRDRSFAKDSPERLKVHEVQVHGLRAANGYMQPLSIFALGLPGYLPTEEGLAAYAEEVTGNTDPQMMRNYASRVIAVDSVCKNLNFRQTFDRLKSYDLSHDQAWTASVRAHRAGGFIKDHVYLDGYKKIHEYAGDFDTLYVGKVGIEDVPMIQRLVRDGTLLEPTYRPDFLKEHSTYQ
ncbi:MAG: tyrosine/phenylalanine carboxypeptidase domain-containing protein [Nanobdellota archaeon]